MENTRFTFVCEMCVRSFVVVGKMQRKGVKIVPQMQHDNFPYLTNNIAVLGRCRCRTSRCCLVAAQVVPKEVPLISRFVDWRKTFVPRATFPANQRQSPNQL